MRSKVSESGVTLPKEWFVAAAEVDTRHQIQKLTGGLWKRLWWTF